MRLITTIFAVTYSCFSFCQTKTWIEIKDFRPDRDSINTTKALPQGIELTSKYVCRIFDFCIPIQDKFWLTSRRSDEKPLLSVRSDIPQLVIHRDSAGRVVSQVYYSCIGCLSESYGYTFSYDSSGNKVTTVQLTAEDIILLRQGIKLNNESEKDHITTFICFNEKGFIQSLVSTFKGDVQFSIKVFK